MIVDIIVGTILSAFFGLSIAAGNYMLLSSLSYSKQEVDRGFNIVKSDMELIKKKVFAEAYAIAEKKKCMIDLNTMECVK